MTGEIDNLLNAERADKKAREEGKEPHAVHDLLVKLHEKRREQQQVEEVK